ncbi:hypothetical protein [Psychrobacter pygoscelis]|uniref:hypothetical protein n=1 Tax=Psychrobacter pygoscelis TaxID=2488563 RepID=UPI001F6249EB|nr:hypothetical protein [Psychrobacter pygoscelis]
MMNILKRVAVSGVALSMASFASAASISGSTDFRVTLPEILVLYHWDDAHLTLTDVATTPDNDSDTGREISDTTAHDLTAPLGNSPYTITGDVATTAPNNALNTVAVTLKNSWAVRSLSSGDVSLSLTNPNSTLKNVTDNSVTITTSNATLASTSNGVAGSNSANMTIPSGWAPVMGDINFDLDLSSANKPGEYNTRGVAGPATTSDEATDTFLLTLQGN